MIIAKEGVVDLLLRVGVRTDLLGFDYIADMLKLCKRDPKLLRGGMMELYKMVGIIHNESSTNVESRIRAAIEKTFEQGNTELLYEMFGSTISQDKAKPTNKQFISTLLFYVK